MKGITPIITVYDASRRRVNLVDKGFIIWLNNQDKKDVLESARLSAEDN